MEIIFQLINAHESMWNIWARRMAWMLLIGLTVFDLLNFLNVLPVEVEFTLFGRVISTAGVLFALYLGEAMLQKKVGRSLPGVVWFSCVIIVFADFIGDVFRVYGSWDRYDQFVHFLSGPCLVASLLSVFFMVAQHARWRIPDIVIYGLALGLNATIATLYEVEEYLEDFFTLSQRLGDGPDTANDLMVNLIGGVGFIISVYLYQKVRQKWRNRRGLSVPIRVLS